LVIRWHKIVRFTQFNLFFVDTKYLQLATSFLHRCSYDILDYDNSLSMITELTVSSTNQITREMSRS